MFPKSVSILVHPTDDFWSTAYTLADMARVLMERGVAVHVGSDPATIPHADIGILHVDVTKVDASFAACTSRFGQAVNFGTLDISKRVICKHVVTQGDGYQGPVIVKTDRNCAGLKEAVAAKRSNVLQRVIRSAHRRLPWTMRAELGGKSYPVFDRVEDVPWMVWNNPWLVVEQFRPERRDNGYVLRSWVFCNHAETLAIRVSATPVVRPPFLGPPNFEEPFEPSMIPDELRARRDQLGFAFGKFDFTVDEQGRVTLFDANRTPTAPSLGAEKRRWQAEKLLHGLMR
ncbi:MAG: hypothetical protein U0640_14330 [Phycisphaerales bacterium]